MTAHHSPFRDQALKLLGSGHSTEVVASAIGVDPSYISQLLAEEEFRTAVTELKYKNLQKHNERDNKLDSLEDKLIERLEKSLPMMIKPSEILNAFRIINSAQRRGHSAPESITNTTQIVQLFLPEKIVTNFVANINNQVVQAGEQQLVTMQSGTLLKQAETTRSAKLPNATLDITDLATKGTDYVPTKGTAPPARDTETNSRREKATSSREESIIDAL